MCGGDDAENGVSRRLRSTRGDGEIVREERVEEGGFAHVGAAQDGDEGAAVRNGGGGRRGEFGGDSTAVVEFGIERLEQFLLCRYGRGFVIIVVGGFCCVGWVLSGGDGDWSRCA